MTGVNLVYMRGQLSSRKLTRFAGFYVLMVKSRFHTLTGEAPHERAALQTVTFRLPVDYVARLSAVGAGFGLSSGQYARRLVIAALDDAERGQIKEELSDVSNRVRDLEENLALAVEALLITAGNYPKEQAREWVLENLRLR